ncbi:hypothetical protein Taro_009721 [Colocasia esculenta]|uniref:Mitochondrial import inner membrane translocase subunit n=1 Tax=Colocasia esculenta TaxID=4460 RepID=A0A843TX45_COLES|nr:hypothetical protein [Colocasia esculenta]
MDKSMLGDLESLPEEDKIKMAQMIDRLQVSDSWAEAPQAPISAKVIIQALEAIASALLADMRCWTGASPRLFAKAIASNALRMYNSLVERCFVDCIDTFRRKSLDKQEETCIRRCAEKFLKLSMRVGMRFAELNQGAATPD